MTAGNDVRCFFGFWEEIFEIMEKTKGITMTSGSLCINTFLFSIPLMLSNVPQVMFNMSDIAVVGRFAGSGPGKTVVPTVVVVAGSCIFRIAWVYTVFAHFRTLASPYLLYPFSLAITAVFEIGYFVFVYRKTFAKDRKNIAGKAIEIT